MKFAPSMRCLLAVSAWMIPAVVPAQAPPAPAPPSQFATAKTVFLGYGGAPPATFSVSGRHASTELYTAAAEAIAATGRWTIVTAPAGADLCMSISVEPASFGDRNTANNARLTVDDCKSHARLWTLEEGIADIPFLSASRSLTKAIGKFTADLNTLASGKLP